MHGCFPGIKGRNRVVLVASCRHGLSPVNLGKKTGHRTEDRGAGGTGPATGRGFVFSEQVPAHLAFDDFRTRLVPLEFRNIELAGHLAVAAAHTGLLIIIDDAGFGVLGKGRCRTRPS